MERPSSVAFGQNAAMVRLVSGNDESDHPRSHPLAVRQDFPVEELALEALEQIRSGGPHVLQFLHQRGEAAPVGARLFDIGSAVSPRAAERAR